MPHSDDAVLGSDFWITPASGSLGLKATSSAHHRSPTDNTTVGTTAEAPRTCTSPTMASGRIRLLDTSWRVQRRSPMACAMLGAMMTHMSPTTGAGEQASQVRSCAVSRTTRAAGLVGSERARRSLREAGRHRPAAAGRWRWELLPLTCRGGGSAPAAHAHTRGRSTCRWVHAHSRRGAAWTRVP